MRTFLVGGSPAARPPVGLTPGRGDRVIAADLGAAHARAWGWPVHLLVGDLDSLPAHAAAALAAAGTPALVAPAAKDESDLELALARAVAEGADTLVICAALGGRADHMLANVLLLARPELAGLDVALVDGNETVRLLRGGRRRADETARLAFAGAPGDLLSLLPLDGDAEGVTTQGLLYPLCNETLHLGQTRGLSNVFTAPEPVVTLRRGLLLAIHTAA